MRAGLCAALVIVNLQWASGQGSDLAGTWKLDQDRSRATEPASVASLAGSGAPAVLYITQPANGTLIVESQINESHSRIYVPGRKATTPITVGPPGSVTMTTRWDGRTLVSEGSRETTTGTSSAVTELKEVFAVSADGSTLTIEVTATADGKKSVSQLTYTRLKDVGPCQSWPTPCKTPP